MSQELRIIKLATLLLLLVLGMSGAAQANPDAQSNTAMQEHRDGPHPAELEAAELEMAELEPASEALSEREAAAWRAQTQRASDSAASRDEAKQPQ